MFAEPDFLRFASDATLAGIWGGALLLLALISLLADWRRVRRKRIDAVGWMPWTEIFFVTMFIGVSLLAIAVRAWVAG